MWSSVIATNRDAQSFTPAASTRRARGGSHRVGLDRRAGLARDDEERRAGPAQRVADRRGIGRIEHAEPRLRVLASKQPTEHFRREARSAHAEQHDVGECTWRGRAA